MDDKTKVRIVFELDVRNGTVPEDATALIQAAAAPFAEAMSALGECKLHEIDVARRLDVQVVSDSRGRIVALLGPGERIDQALAKLREPMMWRSESVYLARLAAVTEILEHKPRVVGR
jgi:hypothetical protein